MNKKGPYWPPCSLPFPTSCMVFKLVRLFCARIGTPLRLVYGASHEEESIDSNMVVFPFHQTFTSKPLLSASAQQHRAEFWQGFVCCLFLQFCNLISAQLYIIKESCLKIFLNILNNDFKMGLILEIFWKCCKMIWLHSVKNIWFAAV